MKNFLEIRPPATPTMRPAYEFGGPSPLPNTDLKNEFAKKNYSEISNSINPGLIAKNFLDVNAITRDAFKKNADKNENTVFHDVDEVRRKRNMAIARLMQEGGIRELTADDILRHAQNLREAQNGPSPFIQVKGV